MRLLVQRETRAAVRVNHELVSEIAAGYLVLLGVAGTDTHKEADFLVDKLLHLRVLADDAGKMNKNVMDKNGQILVVSQFTLYGDTSKGRRPGFGAAAPLDLARELYEYFVQQIRASGLLTATGTFQAHMEVELVNDGPVTFLLES